MQAVLQAAMMICLLLAISKLKGVEPIEWLTHTLTCIQDHPAKQLADLLPIRE
jgi:hypothetical protein